MAPTLSENTSSSTFSMPAFRARDRQASNMRRPIPCRLHSKRTPMPRRPTCVNPLAGFGRMSQNPTTSSSTTAITCGKASSTTRFRKSRVCSSEKPSTVAKYHFSAATALTASRADAVSDSRVGLICTCGPLCIIAFLSQRQHLRHKSANIRDLERGAPFPWRLLKYVPTSLRYNASCNRPAIRNSRALAHALYFAIVTKCVFIENPRLTANTCADHARFATEHPHAARAASCNDLSAATRQTGLQFPRLELRHSFRGPMAVTFPYYVRSLRPSGPGGGGTRVWARAGVVEIYGAIQRGGAAVCSRDPHPRRAVGRDDASLGADSVLGRGSAYRRCYGVRRHGSHRGLEHLSDALAQRPALHPPGIGVLCVAADPRALPPAVFRASHQSLGFWSGSGVGSVSRRRRRCDRELLGHSRAGERSVGRLCPPYAGDPEAQRLRHVAAGHTCTSKGRAPTLQSRLDASLCGQSAGQLHRAGRCGPDSSRSLTSRRPGRTRSGA